MIFSGIEEGEVEEEGRSNDTLRGVFDLFLSVCMEDDGVEGVLSVSVVVSCEVGYKYEYRVGSGVGDVSTSHDCLL